MFSTQGPRGTTIALYTVHRTQNYRRNNLYYILGFPNFTDEEVENKCLLLIHVGINEVNEQAFQE